MKENEFKMIDALFVKSIKGKVHHVVDQEEYRTLCGKDFSHGYERVFFVNDDVICSGCKKIRDRKDRK
jgi:hypothetical protein